MTASWVLNDPAAFPKMASHLSHSFDSVALSKFQLNVVRSCTQSQTAASFAANPNQVNFMVPGDIRGTAGCGAERGFAITYGNGYRATGYQPVVSPWPGIGTIRPFLSTGPLADQDQLYSSSGVIVDVPYSGFRLSMDNNGNDEATAEWAARIKAHYALEAVNGSFVGTGYHGLWGDDFLWWGVNFAGRSPTADPYQPVVSSAANYDDGLVRNHQKLRAILGEDVLLAGNAGNSIASGIHSYYGTIPNGYHIVDGGMWENETSRLSDPASWDLWTPRFDLWQKQKNTTGRQTYGIITIYGGLGSGNLGHLPTAAEKRLALAWACIGGAHLWLVHDNAVGWGTTIYPSGPNSIPEMGENATYPRGWLGQPTGDPIRVQLGLWKRHFTGGIVYANTTGGQLVVDGVTVPADDAVFVKQTSGGAFSERDLRVRGFLREQVQVWRAEKRTWPWIKKTPAWKAFKEVGG